MMNQPVTKKVKKSKQADQFSADAEVSNPLLRAFRPVAKFSFNALGKAEHLIWPNPELQFSPVFIVAPPRSGTTLVSQLMTGHMSTCYFTNLAQRLRVQGSEILPGLSAYLVKLLQLDQRQDSSFDSYYGATIGWGAPNEANGIWERWFPEDQDAVPPGYLTLADRQGVYRAVAVTEKIFQRPFLNKCIRNSVRIEALAEIFPTALFIQCLRNPLDIAQSIFVARTKDLPFKVDGEGDDPLKWWFSVKPKEYHSIKHKSMVEQVCEQVFFVEQSILEARQTVGEDRFYLIDYKILCEQPQQELSRIALFMSQRGAPTHFTKAVPASFPYSSGCKIEPTHYQALADCLEQLYGHPMPTDSN